MKQFVKVAPVTYSDEEVLLAAKCGHSVMQCVGSGFGHKALPQWAFCSDDYKEKVLRNTQAILNQARSCRALHNGWVKVMIHNGWTLGERDNEKKQHPHLMDFNDLPADVRLKMKAFRAAVMPFRKNLGPGFHTVEE